MRKHQFLPPHSTIVKFHRSWEEQVGHNVDFVSWQLVSSTHFLFLSEAENLSDCSHVLFGSLVQAGPALSAVWTVQWHSSGACRFARWHTPGNYTIEVYRNAGESLILTPRPLCGPTWWTCYRRCSTCTSTTTSTWTSSQRTSSSGGTASARSATLASCSTYQPLMRGNRPWRAIPGYSPLNLSFWSFDYYPSQVPCARDIAGPVHQGMRRLQPGNHNVGACLRLGPAQARRPLAEDQDGGTWSRQYYAPSTWAAQGAADFRSTIC